MLTVQQAAQTLGLHESRIKALIKAGQLKATKFGSRVWMIDAKALEAFRRKRAA
jgi:excisionase family DNA binding protein